MQPYSRSIQIRWSDMDPNRHLRHSVYYDYGATVRMMMFSDQGLTLRKLEELGIGPILFREEALFKREITMEDRITLEVTIVKATHNFSRWNLRHRFIKEDGTVAALLDIDAAWMDLTKRKLTVPNEFVASIFSSFPKSEDFEWIVREHK